MIMPDTVSRFSNRVANYIKYRPGYPSEMFGVFRDEMNWTADSVVADIGSGPGISSIPFLDRGNTVYGVEPNENMRAAAEELMSGYAKFFSVNGTAENTALPDDSVDLVIAAQAFHWFDPRKVPQEFERIARPGGSLALIWNERLLDADPFHVEYEAFLKHYASDYDAVRHDRLDAGILSEFFGKPFSRATFQNAQVFDLQGLRGRALSSSYMPSEDDERIPALDSDLKSLFDKYSENGRIQVLYQTNIFYIRL